MLGLYRKGLLMSLSTPVDGGGRFRASGAEEGSLGECRGGRGPRRHWPLLAGAEGMAEAGGPDIFIASQVVGPPKLERLAELAQKVKLSVGVDSVEVAAPI